MWEKLFGYKIQEIENESVNNELEKVRNQAVSDSGDRLAVLKALYAELVKLTEKVASDTDLTIKDVDRVIRKVKNDAI